MDEVKIKDLLLNNDIIKIVMSDSLCNIKKISIRKLVIKQDILYQLEYIENNKAYHKNLEKEKVVEYVKNYLYKFKQILIRTKEKEYILNLKKNSYKLKVNENNNDSKVETHNKEKKYFLNQGDNIPFLKELGIMNEKNEILKKGYNKFRQINKYLEIIDNTISKMLEDNLIKTKINIVDFACGKSYLSFATYYYLEKYRPNLDFSIIGLDLKTDVIKNCTNLAEKLEYGKMVFLNEDIKDFLGEDIDLVFSLHACNNATDYSILKALELDTKAFLAVPCCHNEFYKNIKIADDMNFMKKNPIIFEKFSSLLTDTYRAKFLELCGYDVLIEEFINEEFTPKNLLIKSIKNSKKVDYKKIEKEYLSIKEKINYTPILENIAKKYMKK
ncbi:class I SAM-dependent methyltransferase [Oceanivirga miroungae]|uniref:Methyltransferase domain-containing protein n=1 Tax=Oceanivirga miroungae TaxID=1130046 RepID=A0A6I8M8U8_9FUSO|nr:SAM-dependent methyltransferase [Oceanivirga miroungae]VWL85960.1 hypothetical protein OMES3154_01251 [Oceanivirga miroungae]